MFLKILKNDLKRKKAMNFILFIFILIASMFMAAGVNNVYQTTTALDYYEDKADMCDLVILMNSNTDQEKTDQLLNENENVKNYVKANNVYADKDNLSIKDNEEFEVNLTTLLSTMPEGPSKVFDDEGNPFTVAPGEIAIAKKIALKFGIDIGDTMTFQLEDYEKDFIVTELIKDYTYGSDIISVARYIISQQDYEELMSLEDIPTFIVYYIESSNAKQLQNDINETDISVMGVFQASMFKMAYFMVMTTATIIMLVSVAIILIAFLALRFSILFTVESEYKKIGIMKAVGMRNNKIRRIYLAKYFGISVISAAVGLTLSFPFGNLLLKSVKTTLLMQDGNSLFLVNIIAAIVTVIIVIMFSYLCTRRVKKYSAIEAIRSGSSGERFKSKQKIKLHNKRKLKSITYMAMNDILSNLKKYIVLILTFAVGLMLIITPMNLSTTLVDNSMISIMGNLESEFYFSPSKDSEIIKANSIDVIDNMLSSMKEDIYTQGIDIKLSLDIMYSLTIYKDDIKNSIKVSSAIQNRYESAETYKYFKGEAPILTNEVAMTKLLADELGAKIGDTVTVNFGEQEKDYIITGFYQNMNNLGKGFRFSCDEEIDISNISGFHAFYGTITDDSSYEEVKAALLARDPNGKVYSTREMLDKELGGSIEVLNQMSMIIFPVVFIMIAFITLLMVKSFLVKEKREIAMLKVLGFPNGKIKLWQMERIVFASLFGVVLGIAFSKVFDMAGAAIFHMLGLSQFSLIVNPLMAYLIVPVAIVILNAVISLLGMGSIRSVNPMEVNDVE
jgi:putative ABC transport system permease protein